MINNLLVILGLSGFALGIMACGILLFSNKAPKLPNRLLALALSGLASAMLVIFLFKWRPELYAHIYRLPSLFLFLIFPAVFLYAKKMIRNETKLGRKDMLHFLPAFLYMVELIPYFTTSYQYRLQLVNEIQHHPGRLIQLSEGVLPPYYHVVFLCIQSIVYIILILTLLRKATHTKDKNLRSHTSQWMKTFVYLVGILAIPMIVLFLLPQTHFYKGIQFLLISITGSFLAVNLYLFFRPEILYGISSSSTFVHSPSFLKNISENIEGNNAGQTIFIEEEVPENTSETTPDLLNLESYKPVLESYMSSYKPFLKQGYSIQDLSRETTIPQHHLSALLNRIYKLRFTDYINGMRIRFISENLGNSEWEKLTLEGIAKQAGFTSRTTFFNAIKKMEGVTPSEFIMQLKTKLSTSGFAEKSEYQQAG